MAIPLKALTPEQRRMVRNRFSLLSTLGQALGADFDLPTRDAWKAALAAIGQAMTAGIIQPEGDTRP